MRIKVAVVILNWNGRKFLEKFLPSVIRHNPGYSEIYLADNASTDDSIEFTRKNFPGVQIVKNSSNTGFAQGYNDALQHIKAEYYILLNSDVEVTVNWIEPIIDLMDQDHSIAACQPKIKSFYDRSRFEHAGAAGGFIDKFGFPFCRGRMFDSVEEDKGQYDDNVELFWATGACMFVRADLFHKAKGFDGDFFAHMEEIDLCWRLKNMGYKMMYCGNSTVYHVGGGTLQYLNPRKTYLNFRNNLFLLYKNLPSERLFVTLLLRMKLDGIAGIKFLLEGNMKHFTALLKAHRDFYLSFSLLRKKRKNLVQKSLPKEVYSNSIIYQYFIKGKKKFSELGWSLSPNHSPTERGVYNQTKL